MTTILFSLIVTLTALAKDYEDYVIVRTNDIQVLIVRLDP